MIDHSHHAVLNKRAAIASTCTACFLLILKVYAAYVTSSIAMLGSLADSGLDLIASLVTLFAVRYAAMPADNDHRFGHGKAEALSALFQVMLIAASAIAIAWRAAMQWQDGTKTSAPEYGIAVSLIAIAATLALLLYQRRIVKQTSSVAIGADHIHYQSDLLLNAAVIAALILDNIISIKGADALFGIIIAIWLAWGAWRAANEAIDQLMDKEWPEEKRLRFAQIAAQYPELTSLHDLRTRSSGGHNFVQFHVDMNPNMTVKESHDILERVEESLRSEFPQTEILIHIDPEGHVDEPDNPMAEENILDKLDNHQP